MSPPWTAHILTLYPEMFPGPLDLSLAGRAREAGIWDMQCHQMRDYATDKHRSVDDTPAGGGPGMVLRADILARAIDDVTKKASGPLLYLTPRGKPLTQAKVRELAAAPGATLVCGRFEGLDERIYASRPGEEISVGDYILSGGEVAALSLMDAIIRLLPGVVGEQASLENESFETGLLESPHYTRPQLFEGREIPPILLSGDHGKIAEWRLKQAETVTKEQRADLWQQYVAKRRKAE